MNRKAKFSHSSYKVSPSFGVIFKKAQVHLLDELMSTWTFILLFLLSFFGRIAWSAASPCFPPGVGFSPWEPGAG